MQTVLFPFRPWVRRAGASIVMVALIATVAMATAVAVLPRARYGWLGEPFVWLYLAALWVGGLRVWAGSFRPVAEVDESHITLRPLHLLRPRRIEIQAVRGTEQMRKGDRLILYYESGRRTRFVALNLNLIRGRREFLQLLDQRLAEEGFVETFSGESRYLSAAR
jgi:hypothetical protein